MLDIMIPLKLGSGFFSRKRKIDAKSVVCANDGKKMASPCGSSVVVRRTPLRASAIAGTLPALDSFLCADGGGDAISL